MPQNNILNVTPTITANIWPPKSLEMSIDGEIEWIGALYEIGIWDHTTYFITGCLLAQLQFDYIAECVFDSVQGP